MKPCYTSFLLLSFYFLSYAQLPSGEILYSNSSEGLVGGGSLVEQPKPEPCLAEHLYPVVENRLAANRARLVEKGLLPDRLEFQKRTVSHPLFEWPVRQASGFTLPSVYSTNNFVDQNASSGIQDYNCGSRTYNGHRGTDINNWPFWWDLMDNNQVEAVAAAPGIILGKDDGNFDKNCGCSGDWNAVYIEHTDGSQSWYGHLKSGTLTSKPIGSSVATGEYLGIIGSSGCSSNPHLHFEVRDASFNVIDPYTGSCNNLNTDSWWNNQKPYWEPTLNAIFTHRSNPGISGFCPNQEVTNYENDFQLGELATFSAFFHDQQGNDMTSFKVLDANDNVALSWNLTSPGTYSSSYWYWNWILPANHPAGNWKFVAQYGTQIVTHYITVGGCPAVEQVTSTDLTNGVLIKASQQIATSGTTEIPATYSVTFQAGEAIILHPGFHAKQGSTFHAYLAPCVSIPTINNLDVEKNAPFTLPENTGLHPNLTLELSPNPTLDKTLVTYGLPVSANAQLSVFSVTGEQLLTKVIPSAEGINQVEVWTTDYPNGIYFVILQSEQETVSAKLIVQK